MRTYVKYAAATTLIVVCLGVAGNCRAATDSSGAAAAAATTRPWMDASVAPEKRAELLVGAMNLEEKISQIHMMDIKDHPRRVDAVARLGIPVFRITNGPAGAGPGDSRGTVPATALPSALGLAASWDIGCAKKFGEVAGQEVAMRGEHLIEGPGVNITRVPQNGRNFEYFGEDPYLAGRLAVAEIQAIQKQHVMAEVKHYACNNQETDRKTINEIVDERTLREIYLPAFEAAIREGKSAAVMAAYPSVNGEFCSQNTHLLGDILRGEWGFKGFVQSDYTGTQSATKGSEAGLDLSMKADHYAKEMLEAVKSGQVKESTVDTMLKRRFTAMFEYGIFDEPPREQRTIPAKEHGKISREIADECVVLLKNEKNLLPLKAEKLKTIALIGPYAGSASTGGAGSSAVNPLYTVKPAEGLQARAGAGGGGVEVIYNDGSNVANAAAAAKGADVAIVEVGNKDREGKDRPNLQLADKQDDLIAAVAKANAKTIVVLKTGGPVLMPWVKDVAAILAAWYPGEEDGNVIADLVFGDVNPSAKLPMTFPRAENEVPASRKEQYPGVNGTATYSEKLEVGYRWYDAQKVEPLFPFGFGLSYTKFELSDLKATKNDISVTVKNTGDRAGAEVVQVYVAAPKEAGEPPKQLKGFVKVVLRPGESIETSIPLDRRAFSIWDAQGKKWTTVSGKHDVLVGTSSRDLPLHASIEVPSAN